MSFVEQGPREPMVGDPDDHRPKTLWRLVIDPGDDAGRVDGLALIDEQVGIGDRIPLHTHPVDELVAILDGEGEYRLGSRSERVAGGSIVFIPAGTPHATANLGTRPLHLYGIFPTTVVEIAMLERNPAPGTEGEAPHRTRYDFRTGEFEVLD
jgi:mannose-6-phosphate isomerase-like protein (cupin superfamily)